ncbi:MAG TPA: glycosyltransferase family 39 protein [Bacteroidales bacterium]
MRKLNFFKKFNFLKSDLPFLFLFIIFAAFYYDSVLNKGPLNVHLWRQTDCLSITRNYSEGASFFKPETNILLADDNTTSLSVAEFPILYYIVGMIWKLFGESYLSYRLFYLLILFAGLFAFYKSLRIILNNNFWATTISLLLFTSPVYVVYGVSFLTDVPAFSFVLIALYFFLQYHRKKAQKLLFISIAFFALAGLIKISSLIAFIFLFAILILESLSIKSLGKRKLFNCNKYEWTGFISVILVVISWYSYVEYFDALHGFKYSAGSIFPIWNVEKDAIGKLFININNFTSYVFFNRLMLFTLLIIGIINLFLWRRIPVFAYLTNIIIALGGIIYFILWASILGIHDYYFTALLILFVGILIPFIWFIKTNHPDIFNGYPIKIFLVIFLSYNFVYCFVVVKLKTFASQGEFVFVGNQEFVNLMKWTNWDVSTNLNRFESMKPYIREIGIKKEDKVISLPDPSFNISLYFTNQKGWSDYLNYSKSEDIEKLIQKGAKYLFISDPKLLKEEFLAPFLSNKIGDYKGIGIFKLSKSIQINDTTVHLN